MTIHKCKKLFNDYVLGDAILPQHTVFERRVRWLTCVLAGVLLEVIWQNFRG